MRFRPAHRLALGFAAVAALAVPMASAALGAAGCGAIEHEIWICLSPVTGKLDNGIYDPGHYVNGVFDPCHCHDPCGPLPQCPDLIDAGPLPPGCPASDGGT